MTAWWATVPGAWMPLEAPQRTTLLRLARDAIASGLAGHGLALPDDAAPVLREKRASFVTLKLDDALRGFIGTLEAVRPLLEDVAQNARAAAFHDPRFRPLSPAELQPLHIEISVLSPPQPLPAADRDALLTALRPGLDGLILQEGRRRATFLPAVWETLPQPEAFLEQLLRKAGLAPAHWSDEMRFFRYSTESFAEPGA